VTVFGRKTKTGWIVANKVVHENGAITKPKGKTLKVAIVIVVVLIALIVIGVAVAALA
jgi:hypothetical protein